MPLLGRKPFALSSPKRDGTSNDALYVIPHTKERFESKGEYEKRKDLYSQSIWTCRATGHINLTHEEACKSEKLVASQLKQQFPKCFEKAVVEDVHHSTLSLDVLVDQTWLKLHHQLVPGERVNLQVKLADKLIPAKIVSVDKSTSDCKLGSSCNSPSSDKENNSDDKEKSPKKWTPPKLLPYLYSIELENEAKVIHSVPASDLLRLDKVPSKDNFRLFIRVSALRPGTSQTSPWVVNEDLVLKYKLVNKFADFFLSPVKMAEVMKKSEVTGKKRKLSNGTPNSSRKKLKLDKSEKGGKVKFKDSKKRKSGSESKNGMLQKKKAASPKKLSSSPKKGAAVITVSDSEDEIALSKLKQNNSGFENDSDSDVPLYQLVDQTTPKKRPKTKENDLSDDDIPLKKLNSINPKKGGKKSPLKSTPSKKENTTPQKKANLKSPSKAKNGKKLDGAKKLGLKKTGLKQATLFDLTKKGKTIIEKGSPTKASKPSPSKTPQMAPLIKRMMNSKRETLNDKVKYSMLLKKAVNVLTSAQIKLAPEKIREEIDRKRKTMEEKARVEKMSPEEREEYMREKKQKAKQVQKQKMLEKMRDQRKRFEDTDLDLIPLPAPKLVPTPEGFPNELFGDVSMVTEFINCYGGLLMPDSEYPIYTDALMKALVGGSSGFAYTSRVLTVLLQTLLQDEIAKGYQELDMQIADIAVSPFTASELVRLCLQPDEDEDEDDGDVPEEYVRLLKDTEFYQLELEQKVCVLRGLCSRVLGTYSVQDYMDEQQRMANQLTKQKNSELKQIAAQKKSQQEERAVKSQEKAEASPKPEESSKPDGSSVSMSTTSFYGKETEDSGDDINDWGSIVKRRRVLAAKAAAEKEKRDRERMVQLEKEIQKEKEKERLRRKQDNLAETICLARMVLRQEPIGTDRHHDRYWVFSNTTPGLYVEKGWVGQEIKYVARKRPNEDDSCLEDDSDLSSEEDYLAPAPVTQTGNTPLKIKYNIKRQLIETSAPHPGQNLWLTYRSQKDLDSLLQSLHPQGIREALLKAEIKKRYEDISKAILQAQRTNLELRSSDGDEETTSGFKKELSEMELRLRNGGLGGVVDFDQWENRLTNATDISVMGDCLIEVQAGILDKFFQGFMKQIKKEEEEEEEGTKEDGNEEEVPEKEDKREKAIRIWKEAIGSCQTMSRLHVLLAVLDNCIKWEKSAEYAKCKICRKKGNDDRLLLCDECNQAFHIYCLRPALAKVPTVDWFCPACKPRRKLTIRSMESESEEEKDDACRECGGREKLVVCSKCPSAYHTQCHDPPLRHPPRGIWECSDCKNGNSRQRRKRKVAKKQNYRQVSSEDDEVEDEAEESEDAEDNEPAGKGSRSRSRGTPASSSSRSRKSKTPQSAKSSNSRSSQKEQSSSLTPTYRTSRRGPSELSLCEEILARVMKNKLSWPFLEPVDKKAVPDYYQLIKKPMDFQTMQKKCTRLSYASPQEFIEDAALVFENAETYNKSDSEIFTCMREVEKMFKEQLRKLLPDWPYYRTVGERVEETSSGSENGKTRSRNRY